MKLVLTAFTHLGRCKEVAISSMIKPQCTAPKIGNILPDEKSKFEDQDLIRSFDKVAAVKHCPPGYQIRKTGSSFLFDKISFNEANSSPSTTASILIDDTLHVKLHCNGLPVPFSQWFRK